MLKIAPNKFLLQNLQIGKLEGTSGNFRGPSGMLEPDKWGDACARGGLGQIPHENYSLLCLLCSPIRKKLMILYRKFFHIQFHFSF